MAPHEFYLDILIILKFINACLTYSLKYFDPTKLQNVIIGIITVYIALSVQILTEIKSAEHKAKFEKLYASFLAKFNKNQKENLRMFYRSTISAGSITLCACFFFTNICAVFCIAIPMTS